MMKTDVSVVVPVFNEKKSIVELQKEIESVFQKYHASFECVYVDDGSTDGSFEALQTIKKSSSAHIILIRLRKHLGKSAVLAVGFAHTNGDIIITLDADLQDDPQNIPALIDKLHEGYDVVVGWRRHRRDVWHKLLLSRVFNTVVSMVSGIPIHDFNVGLKCYTRQVIREIKLYGELHRYTPLLAHARGFTVAEIPITQYPRKYGSSKFGIGRIFHGGLDLVTTLFLLSFKYQPMNLFGAWGSVFISSGTAILVYLSVLHFIGEKIGTRPLLLFGILLFLFGIQLVFTGLLAELITSYKLSVDDYPVADVIE